MQTLHLTISMLIGIPCTSYVREYPIGHAIKPYADPRPSDPTATGSAGLINTISMLSQGHVLSGVFGVITSVGWTVQTLFGGWLYKRVWDFKNNNEGISFQNVSPLSFFWADGKGDAA